MVNTITINLSDKAWADLLRAGRDRHEAPEKVAEQLLSDVVSDPLLSLSGVIESAETDISAHHDQYLGSGIYAEQGRD